MTVEESLEKLRKEAMEVAYGGLEYWKLRCYYLEKHLDQTYSYVERENCFYLYRTLRDRKP